MSLTHRIVFLIVLALLPLTALQLVTMHELRLARIKQAEGGAMSRAMTIAQQQSAVIESAFSVIHVIAALPAIINAEDDPQRCATTLKAVVAEAAGYNSAAVTDAQGRVICATDSPAGVAVDFSDRLWFQELKGGATQRMVGEQVMSRLNGQRIIPLSVSRPSTGAFIGAISIGLDATYFQSLLNSLAQGPDVTAGLADRHGKIIANLPYTEKYIGDSIFELIPVLKTAQQPGMQRLRGRSGREWLIAYYPQSAPPLQGLYLTVAFNLSALTAPIDTARNTNVLAAISLLVVALLTTAFGARYFIVRPIEKLRLIARRWQEHDFSKPMCVSDPSSELAPLVASLNEMAGELAHSLEQKDLLLREINHRVMNSMQIISSLLVMQSRRLGNHGAKAPLMSAVERINALGTVHRRLHLSASIDTIDLGAFVRDLVVDVGRALGSENTEMVSTVALSMLVTVDDAVCVGLILNEILTNAIKHAKASDERNRVLVTLRLDEDAVAMLSVEDHGGGSVQKASSDTASLGMVVIQSLARQLKANVDFQTTARGVLVVLRWSLLRPMTNSAKAA